MFAGLIDKPRDQLRLGEGVELRFFPREAVSTLPIAFGFRELLEEYFQASASR